MVAMPLNPMEVLDGGTYEIEAALQFFHLTTTQVRHGCLLYPYPTLPLTPSVPPLVVPRCMLSILHVLCLAFVDVEVRQDGVVCSLPEKGTCLRILPLCRKYRKLRPLPGMLKDLATLKVSMDMEIRQASNHSHAALNASHVLAISPRLISAHSCTQHQLYMHAPVPLAICRRGRVKKGSTAKDSTS